MTSVQEAQVTQVLNARSTVFGENFHSIEVVLNPLVQEFLSGMIMNAEKRCMYFDNCCMKPL